MTSSRRHGDPRPGAPLRRVGALLALITVPLGACAVDDVPGEAGTTDGTAVDPGGPAPEPPACAAPLVGPRRIRRLSHAEYGNTVRALPELAGAEDLEPELALSLDTYVDGYDNDADALVVSSVLASQYRVAAESIAEVVRDGLDETLPCSKAPGLDTEGVEACAATFIERFGARAFRRPLTTEETDRYLELWRPIAAEDGLDEGIYWVAAAMLQSPNFLYRSELGVWNEDRGTHVLTPYEAAAQLSYLITARPPDAALLEDVEAGMLAGPDAPALLAEHAERLLAGPHGGEAYADFAEAWLGVRRPRVQPDPDVYYDLDDATRDAMRHELRRSMAEALRDGDVLEDLFDERTTWVTPGLGAYYGVGPLLPETADARGQIPVELPPERAGLLARGRVLTVYADPAASAPVQRGKMVRERLLCQELPPPPPNVDANPIPPNDTQTTRERLREHTDNPGCFGCHKFMDPLGFGFEHFDGIGRWRDTENEQPIDASGTIYAADGTAGPTFVGLEQLQRHLQSDPAVHACYVQQWTQFASAAPPEQTECLGATLQSAFDDSGGRLDAPIEALVRSPWFWNREDGG